jgi:protein Tex
MQPIYINAICNTAQVSEKQVLNIIKLTTEGATIPFIARYRKEATGNLDEVAITTVVEAIHQYNELEKRKETILKTIEGLGKLDDTLKKQIGNCIQLNVLEDLYLPFKPKRRTKAIMAIEKGLEPLANELYALSTINLETQAQQYITEQVPTIADALQGARDIVAEKIAEHVDARNAIRNIFERASVLKSKLLTSKKEEEDAQKYRDYFAFEQSLQSIPSHRLLAIRRGEKEGFLTMSIDVDKEKACDCLTQIFITKHENITKAHPTAKQHMQLAIEDGFTRLLKNQVETEFRLSSKQIADEEAIKVFADNLRQLLMESPLGQKRIMALDPGFRTGCKLVCLDEQGNFLYNTTIYPHPPQQDEAGSQKIILELVKKYTIEAIGYGNGTAGRETDALLRSIAFDKPIDIFMVNESGASIYSASEVAREEFPNEDVTVRGAISIGRRLLDPLSELVKIDAKSIGVGQYQHDVNQTRLKEMLDNVVISCVNNVGVDINTASKHLLMYVSGLNATISANIVAYRAKHGPFTSRETLKQVTMLGPKTFEQCAGFLRVPNARNPLDNSGVHPERYELVNQMASAIGTSIEQLITDENARKKINPKQFINEAVGLYTIEDILKELEKPGRDLRGILESFSFDPNIKTIADVNVDMVYPGIVTNITKFGAFVSIGVKQDGMVHISHMSHKFISDPNEVVKLNQKVMVKVLEVDISKHRISLSIKEAQANNSAQKPIHKPTQIKNKPHKETHTNDFQQSLAALKNKFSN